MQPRVTCVHTGRPGRVSGEAGTRLQRRAARRTGVHGRARPAGQRARRYIPAHHQLLQHACTRTRRSSGWTRDRSNTCATRRRRSRPAPRLAGDVRIRSPRRVAFIDSATYAAMHVCVCGSIWQTRGSVVRSSCCVQVLAWYDE